MKHFLAFLGKVDLGLYIKAYKYARTKGKNVKFKWKNQHQITTNCYLSDGMESWGSWLSHVNSSEGPLQSNLPALFGKLTYACLLWQRLNAAHFSFFHPLSTLYPLTAAHFLSYLQAFKDFVFFSWVVKARACTSHLKTKWFPKCFLRPTGATVAIIDGDIIMYKITKWIITHDLSFFLLLALQIVKVS